jgi:NAD(P)-dependent dehydrogenase (short-subunit alcohol dehydrogenase family)
MAYQHPPLDGRVVVVTGTSRGVGVGLAARFVEAGARVVGCSRGAPSAELPPADDYLHVIHDIAKDAPEALLSVALQRFGRVDGLVNNAAIEHYGDCWSQSDAELDEMLEINLTGPFLLTQAFARHWAQSGAPGAVVNIGSVECQVGWPDPGQAAYAITKGGLLGLTRSLALDLADHGVRVTAVGPGSVATEMAAPAESGYMQRIPLGGVPGTPQDVADAAIFLMSDAARYVTGEILYVDGGYLIP